MLRSLVALVVLTGAVGCSLPFDDFTPLPGDAATDSAIQDAKVDSAKADAASDGCVCVKYAGGKCREYSPPGCM
jgi:hypothetical protein